MQEGDVLVDRRDVHDTAAMAALDHVSAGRLGGEEGALEIDSEHQVVVLLRDIDERLADLDPGVVDQDVEAAEGLDGGADEALGLLGPPTLAPSATALRPIFSICAATARASSSSRW